MLSEKNLQKKILSLFSKTRINASETEPMVSMLAQGGSERIFYRVAVSDKTYVLMTSQSMSYETKAYYNIGRLLFSSGVGVPEFIAFDEENGLLLMEDLGDDSMLNLLGRAESRAEIERIYKMVIEALSEMQLLITPVMNSCDFLQAKDFGYEALRWETDYFLECFVKGYCNLEPENEGAFEDEMDRLALILSTEPRYFMHRDFQSQNIYIKDGRVRIIDFQTAKKGICFYDVASVLKDSYFRLYPDERQRLLNHYLNLFLHAQGMSFNSGDFLEIFHLTGLQRNMQALGAFAYLATAKGKKSFLQHIPLTISYLEEALLTIGNDFFPQLGKIVKEIKASGFRLWGR